MIILFFIATNKKDVPFKELELILEEEMFITLSFIGSALNKINGTEEENKIIHAFKYAWNVTKHAKKVYRINDFNYDKTSILGLGKVGQMRLGNYTPQLFWKELPFEKGGFENHHKKYMDNLYSKDIPDKLNEIYRIIDKYL
ncbi:hypothetical protein [Carnobacterium viridans]|uniref:Uncharacterized protein n=1 Tax=Carnobacterium viridans TaxID=174587 RepID=A0A1H0XIJ7_9LACT|nr:hypothetical protein [Carnobacterium viridans]SDQ02748.1 hypothetical protein SAMN04487752_0278 [Carnobacterium viridans]